jgi:hypothetical protein
MHLARLDSEVFFKRTFTDPFVLKAFVRDIVGIELEPDSIETEKAFSPQVGSINFKYDIFAEDSKNRVIVEIQRMDYDYNFDRFLHYHLAGIIEQQNSYKSYMIGKTVFTIVVMTAPYRVNMATGLVYEDEVLITSLNPRTIFGEERRLFNHELVFLNPSYRSESTPEQYRDWLDLIYESIHNPKEPHVNMSNAGIRRATELLENAVLDGDAWAEAKIAEGRKIVRELDRAETARTIAMNLKQSGIESRIIAQSTGLSEEEINAL